MEPLITNSPNSENLSIMNLFPCTNCLYHYVHIPLNKENLKYNCCPNIFIIRRSHCNILYLPPVGWQTLVSRAVRILHVRTPGCMRAKWHMAHKTRQTCGSLRVFFTGLVCTRLTLAANRRVDICQNHHTRSVYNTQLLCTMSRQNDTYVHASTEHAE